MQRRSALGRLAATAAGLSLGRVPDLPAAMALRVDPFSVTPANLPRSTGTVTCPACQTMWDSLHLTPAGLCLSCADADPTIRAEPHSQQFWTLSPGEVRRLESEIRHLADKLELLNQRLVELRQERGSENSQLYDRAVEKQWNEWHALQRELHLLHLLRAASRQFS